MNIHQKMMCFYFIFLSFFSFSSERNFCSRTLKILEFQSETIHCPIAKNCDAIESNALVPVDYYWNKSSVESFKPRQMIVCTALTIHCFRKILRKVKKCFKK